MGADSLLSDTGNCWVRVVPFLSILISRTLLPPDVLRHSRVVGAAASDSDEANRQPTEPAPRICQWLAIVQIYFCGGIVNFTGHIRLCLLSK